jgi:hypothetical protein
MDKPESLITAWRNYYKTGIYEVIRMCWINIATDKSRIRGMCHGDFWLNNMLFNEDKSKV